MLSRAGDHVPSGVVMQTNLPIIGNAVHPGSVHAHGQLFVPPPPPVYVAPRGPPNDMISFAMFVHSDRSQLSAGEK